MIEPRPSFFGSKIPKNTPKNQTAPPANGTARLNFGPARLLPAPQDYSALFCGNCTLRRQIAQYVMQHTAVFDVLHLNRGIDAAL